MCSTRTVTKRSLDLSLAHMSAEQVEECVYPESYIPPIVPYAVFGDDGRNQVTDTTVFPYSAICYLKIEWSDGSGTERGTGVVISNKSILTAAHNVFQKGHNGYAKKITIYPGRNGSIFPYGTYSVSRSGIMLPFTRWKSEGGAQNDVALIRVNGYIGATTGIMGYGNYADSTLLSTKLRITGYPSDKSGKTLWKHARKINSVTSKLLKYIIDTAGGQSGAPIYMIANNQVVGVHSRADDADHPTENLGRRIDSELFSILQNRKAEDQ